MQMLTQLGATGVLVAMLPLTLVWVSRDADKYRKLVWVVVFLTFDLIMFGAFTRLTDSGLGCPDWPGCYGHANPFSANEAIAAAETALPGGPVTVFKAWVEMIHRYLAMAVGVLIVTLLIAAWRCRQKQRKAARTDLRNGASPGFSATVPAMLFLLVCLQGAFGAWTVTLKLQPVIVTIHLLLGMALLALLTWHGAQQNRHAAVGAAGRQLALPALLTALSLVAQIALGGWVSTNYAVLACSDFPLCQGALVPAMDFTHGFSLWRHLGKTSAGDYLPFTALVAIHWVHRCFAYIVIASVLWTAVRARRDTGLRKTGTALLAIIFLQFCTGVSTVLFKWPLPIAVLHNGGAALLLLLTVMLNFKIRFAPGHGFADASASEPTASPLVQTTATQETVLAATAATTKTTQAIPATSAISATSPDAASRGAAT